MLRLSDLAGKYCDVHFRSNLVIIITGQLQVWSSKATGGKLPSQSLMRPFAGGNKPVALLVALFIKVAGVLASYGVWNLGMHSARSRGVLPNPLVAWWPWLWEH